MPRSYDVCVVVPWLPSDVHRERAWEWVRARYAAAHPDWQVVDGRGGSPWRKAVAVADGLERATGDILVIADADVWVDDLELAVTVLHDVGRWVIPHCLVHRLTLEATEAVYAGSDPVKVATRQGLDQRPYRGWAGGGVVIARREDYERAPIDPRFAGWGSEDAALALTLDTLVGPHVRLDGDLWHLWHPPQQRLNRVVGNEQSDALLARYRKARRHPDRMAELVDEGRQAWPVSNCTAATSPPS